MRACVPDSTIYRHAAVLLVALCLKAKPLPALLLSAEMMRNRYLNAALSALRRSHRGARIRLKTAAEACSASSQRTTSLEFHTEFNVTAGRKISLVLPRVMAVGLGRTTKLHAAQVAARPSACVPAPVLPISAIR